MVMVSPPRRVSLAAVLTGAVMGAVVTAAAAQAGAPPAAALCTSCHGEGGSSAVPLFPHLAAQQAAYTDKQLRDFIAGKRKNDVMAPILASVKDADIAPLAAYFAAQKPAPAAAAGDAALAARGKQIFDDGNTASGVPACVGCHQAGAVGNDRYPRLAGQHAAYSADQVRKFRSGERNNDKAKVMRAVAARLTDEEIDAVSAYLAGLP